MLSKRTLVKLGFHMKALLLAASFFFAVPGFAVADDGPPVKKSSTGICHAKGSTYYVQTKRFTAYNTMDECMKSGGRLPKR